MRAAPTSKASEIAVSDPLAATFARIVAAAGNDPARIAAGFLDLAPVFGDLVAHAAFRDAVTRNVVALFRDGVQRDPCPASRRTTDLNEANPARSASRPPVPRRPGNARARARALRDGEGPADRQPARPHRSAMVRRRRAVRERVGAAHHARSLRVPDALQPGRPARGARHPAPRRRRRERTSRKRRAQDLADVRRALSPVSRHADQDVARPCVRDRVRHRRAADARIRGPLVRPHQRLPRAAGVPAARAVRALQHRGAGDDRIAARSARASREDPRLGMEGTRGHRVPPRSRRRSGVRRLSRQRRAAGRDHRREHGDVARLSRRASQSPRVFQDDGRDVDRPRSSDRATCDLAETRVPAAARPRAGRHRHRRGRRGVPRPDADRDGADEPRRRSRDADPSRQLPQSQSARSFAITVATRAPTFRREPITCAR